jgi:hypothetical protein
LIDNRWELCIVSIHLQPPVTPFELAIDPTEAEDRLGSYRANVRCRILHSGDSGQFLYEACDLWFGYADFDSFVVELTDVLRDGAARACLHDLSDYFRLTFAFKDDAGMGTIEIVEPLDCRAHLEASFGCDCELAGVVLAKFREFPRWC